MNVLFSSLLALSLAFAAMPAVAAGEPHDLTPAAVAPSEGTDEDEVYEEAPRPAIHVGQMTKPNTDNFGILPEGQNGMPQGVWQNDSRATDDFLLYQLRTGIANETIRTLLIKVLTLQSPPPPGPSSNDWFTVRLSALSGLGQDGKIVEMLQSVPRSIITQNMLRQQTELELAQGNYDAACKKAAAASTSDPAAALFWQKLMILCQLHNGKSEQAAVGLDALHETDSSDTFFQEAVQHVIDKNVQIKNLPKTITLFDFALLKMGNATERLKDRIETVPSVAVKYLAQDTTIDEKLREKAVARAQQMGILPVPDSNKPPETPFSRPVESDVITLVSSLGAGDRKATDADNAVIARLALDDTGVLDCRRIQRLLTLMQVFGYTVPDAIWEKLFVHKNRFDGEAPPAIWVDHITQAAQANRKGEVILLAALIMGVSDADKVNDLALLPVVKALKQVGFEKEARQIAYSAVKMYH